MATDGPCLPTANVTGAYPMDMEGVPGDDFFVTLGQYASDQEVVERILSARALAWQGPQNYDNATFAIQYQSNGT